MPGRNNPCRQQKLQSTHRRSAGVSIQARDGEGRLAVLALLVLALDLVPLAHILGRSRLFLVASPLLVPRPRGPLHDDLSALLDVLLVD